MEDGIASIQKAEAGTADFLVQLEKRRAIKVHDNLFFLPALDILLSGIHIQTSEQKGRELCLRCLGKANSLDWP